MKVTQVKIETIIGGPPITHMKLSCGHWTKTINARGTHRRRMIATEQECPICKEQGK